MAQQGGPDWATLLGMGVTVALCLVAGMGLGWLVDRLADTFPVFVFLGLGFGIAAACGYTVSAARRFFR